jgi:hypothetical protein
MDLLSAPLRDCISYYNGDGRARPGSLAYYGGGERWHNRRVAAQQAMTAYVFDAAQVETQEPRPQERSEAV